MPALIFAIAAAVFLGRFELRSDDTGVEVALILLFTFILGCWQPKRAWLVALLGSSVPLAQLFFGPPTSKPWLHLGPIAAVTLVLGLAGSFAGVLARRLLPNAKPR